MPGIADALMEFAWEGTGRLQKPKKRLSTLTTVRDTTIQTMFNMV